VTPRHLPDPTTLVFAAPVISLGEDWRERSLISWLALAGHAGIEAKPTEAGGQGFSGTWCGNVMIDGLVYRVQRAPRLRMAMLDEHARTFWVLHSATYVEPVTNGVEVIDPRDDRRQLCVIEPADDRPVDLLRLDLATPEAPAPREAGPELT
jgi:hypothetical protein